MRNLQSVKLARFVRQRAERTREAVAQTVTIALTG